MNLSRTPADCLPTMNLMPHQQFFPQNQMQYHSSFNPGTPMMTPQKSVPSNPMQSMQPLSMMPPIGASNSPSMNATALNSLQSQQLPMVPPNQTIRPGAQIAPQNSPYSAMQLRQSEQPAASSFANSNSFAGPHEPFGATDSMALSSLLPPANMLDSASLAGTMNELDGDLEGHHPENVRSRYRHSANV